MPPTIGNRLLVCLAVMPLVAIVSSSTARAEGEDPAAVEKVTKLNKKAVDEYQNLNFEESRKLLRSAIDACAQLGLENHPVTARTYIHLGIVTFLGFKQRDEAVKYFRKALEIQGDIKLDKILATPEVQEVFDEALEQHKEASASTKKPSEDAPSGGIEHEPVKKAVQGAAIEIRASVGSSLGAKKVVLSFSADGADDFAEREMKEDPPGSNTYVTEIPASATLGAVVDYFIEAFGDGDAPVAATGSSKRTQKIAMLGPDGQPVASAARKGKKPDKKPAPKADESPSWLLGIGFGSGVGWATGNGEVNAMDVVKPAGFAMSKAAHIVPELGYYVSPEFLLSFQMRLQFVTGGTSYYSPNMQECGDGICEPGKYAVAGFLRGTYFFGDGDLRTYVAGTAGLGTIRHVATFESQQNCGPPPPGSPTGNQTCIDTVPSGPAFVGAGAGIMYNVSPVFVLTLGTNALVGFSKFTFHVDLNAGVAFEF